MTFATNFGTATNIVLTGIIVLCVLSIGAYFFGTSDDDDDDNPHPET